jgi:DNA-binding MarR family transcriptional regulator
MSGSNLDQSLGFLVHDVARLWRKRFEQRAKALGLTRAQWQALAHLKFHQGINQSGLAEILEIEPITVARLIDRMEEAGWVERRPDPADRRAYRLYMTARAQGVLDAMRELGDAVRGEALSGFGRDEQTAVFDLMSRIRRNLTDTVLRRGRNSRAPRAVEAIEDALESHACLP